MIILQEHHPTPSSPQPPILCKWSKWNDLIVVDESFMVLFNTWTQNAVLTKKEEYISVINLTTEQFIIYYRLGMIVPQALDEAAMVEQRFEQGKKDLSYLDLTILLTYRCQFRCTYCFEGTKKDIDLDDTTADNLLMFLEDHAMTWKKIRVTWFGGEPLVAYSRMEALSRRLIAFCDQHGIDYSADMVTNGFALTESRCRALVNEMRVKRYILTLDGPAPIHDKRRPLLSGQPTFHKIWENITFLIQYGAKVNIRMTIDKQNLEAIPILLDEIAAGPFSGKTGLSFCRTMDFDFTPDKVKDVIFNEKEFADIEWGLIQHAHQLGLYRYRFPHSAPLGGCLREGDIVMGPHGEIFKCLDTVGDPKWVSGRIQDRGQADRPEWYEQWLRWTPAQSTPCRGCVLQPLCQGGCPHNALFSDKKHGTTIQCPDWKANYRRQIIELAKEYIHKNNPTP